MEAQEPKTERSFEPVIAGCTVFVVAFLTQSSPVAKVVLIIALLVAAWIAQRKGACHNSHVLAVFAAVGVWSQVALRSAMDERIKTSLFWVSAAAAALLVVIVLRKSSNRDYVFMSAVGALVCTHGFWR